MLRSPLLRVIRTPQVLRAYSTQTNLSDIDASKLAITRTQTPGALKNPEDLIFGRNFTGIPAFPTAASVKKTYNNERRPHAFNRVDRSIWLGRS